jgi:hypothetical protein
MAIEFVLLTMLSMFIIEEEILLLDDSSLLSNVICICEINIHCEGVNGDRHATTPGLN